MAGRTATVQASARRVPPGPVGRRENLRVLGALSRNPLAAGIALQRRYGDLVRVMLPRGHELYLLCHPEHAEHVFVARQDNYVKAITYEPLRVLLGNGLVTSEGTEWERHRRLIQPLFSHRRVMALGPLMVRNVRRTLDQWDRRPNGGLVSVSEAMSLLTLNIVGEALFGSDLSGPGARVSPSVTTMQDFAVTAMRNPLLLTSVQVGLRTTPGYRRWSRSVHELFDVVDQLTAERRAHPRSEDDPRKDLLDALLEARYDDGSSMSNQQLRDEIMTFLMAGHETSATALTWTMYLLSANPVARARLEQEVDTVLGGRDPEAADLDRLVWTKAVVSEAMRLYPPFWTLERDALGDDEVDGVRIPAGATVAVPPYLVHRHPSAWENPEGFRPERFLPGANTGRHKYAYIPFSGGRRGCVGNVFALMEMAMAVAMIAQRFRLDMAPGGVPRLQPTVTLRPHGGLRMVLRRRTDAAG